MTAGPARAARHPRRSVLTAEELRGGRATGPVDDSAFAIPAGAAGPRHCFSGSLVLGAQDHSGGWTVLTDERGLAASAVYRSLPEMDLTFVQTGDHLVPVTQGLQYTGHAAWNVIVGPGRIWHEDGDGGADRAAFPFTLCHRNSNDTFNGAMTFLFDGGGVSDVRFQITQEICTWLRFDRWGRRRAAYVRKTVPGSARLRRAHLAEVADRIPVRPLEQLAADHPAAGIDVANFGRGVTASAISALGVYYNGVNYTAAARTRHGLYAFPESLRLASYSLAKTALTNLARLRLSRKYGEDVGSLLVRELVPEAAGSPGDWSAVTVDNVLDMATGNYASPGYEVDEDGKAMDSFVFAEPEDRKTTLAFDWPHAARPGTYWNYRTSDIYLAALALSRYLERKEGDGADLYAFLDEEVYRPAGLSAGFRAQCLRTDNSATGQPLGGYGLYFTQDDAAKLSRFLNVDLGRAGGRQLLDRKNLLAALQRDPADHGLPCLSSGKSYLYYNQCTWAVHVEAANPAFDEYGYPAGTDFWVPSMSGVSGDEIVMMPNGATYYYFSDNLEYAYLWPVFELHKLPAAEGTPGW
ncbi:hypothetical protein [Amycolatopsis sp. PS_44_ISF1]|uniref:hypothetical protein n=1 Tax=Amycolatopsis sp. PS_44_ISF1 TaxID=2974917 RepID=UPI0028DF788F|nr:hypothetical protein [Amycolatopsis sp. PS_44_ISF1]MDT8912297.1 hypothetical protein [Amycolatopsis sp. PS_44_ISF1]